ncbi:MAG: sensor hybrid histidine kinase [Phycisphaerales bacterium]|nr:sensor hybrid histidine kinase [Phycisphaerales bacterium]
MSHEPEQFGHVPPGMSLEELVSHVRGEAAERVARIYESITDGLLILDRDWQYIYVNHQAELMLRLSRAELLGNSLWKKFPYMAGTEVARQLHRVVAEQITSEFEGYNEVWKRWYENRASPTPEGGVAVYFRDITGRKLTEENLRRSETLLAEAQELAHVGSWNWDMVTDLLTWSDEHYRICGLERQAGPMTLERGTGVIHPDDLPRVRRQLDEALRDRKPYECSSRLLRTDGSLRIVHSRGQAVYDQAGKAVRMFGTLQDITERVRGEEQANKLKDEFLAMISHELRTPLAAILLWGRMLVDGTVGEQDRPMAFHAIVSSAEAQNKLIGDLLDGTRMITGKLRMDVREIELSTVVQGAIDVLRPAADAKRVLLDPPATFGSAMRMLGDPDRLWQIVWNLLSNAVKFTPSGGRVEVRLERVGATARLTVRDSGKGISAEFLPYVFDRFRQADGSLTRAHSGLGLGLAIVRELVQLHGGSVRSESAGEGHGATFTVDLPLVEDVRAGGHPSDVASFEREGAPGAVRPLQGLRVLVIEDEPKTREALVWVLKAAGALVTGVETAAAAFDALGRYAIDVIISDIALPDEDGYSLLQRARRAATERGGQPVPALALTAYARPEDRHLARVAGFDAYSSKPIQPAELVRAVAKLAGQELAG